MNEPSDVSVPEPLDSQAAPAWLLPALVICGIVAAIAGGAIILQYQKFYFTPEPGMPPYPAEYLAQSKWDNTRNHAIGFSGMGAILIGSLGLLIGLARSLPRAVVGGLTGGVLGGVLGGVMGAVGYLIYARLLGERLMEGMLKAVLIFGPIWLVLCIVSAVLGMLLDGKRPRLGKALYLGVGWAFAAIILYPLVTVILFPVGRPEMIVPEHTGVRYSAYIIGCVCVALAASGVALLPRRKPAQPAATE